MNYIALTPCKFSKQYYIGDTIPGKEILPSMVTTLIKRGIIAKLGDNITTTEPTVTPGAQPEDDLDEPVEALTKGKLNKMNKEQLIETATRMCFDVDETMTNPQLVEIIMLGQTSEDGGE